MIYYKNGNLLVEEGSFCMLNKPECFGIFMDDNTILEIEGEAPCLLHKNKDYSIIAEYPLTKESIISLLPKRKYSNDEKYTVFWYIYTLLEDIPFTMQELEWIINQMDF